MIAQRLSYGRDKLKKKPDHKTSQTKTQNGVYATQAECWLSFCQTRILESVLSCGMTSGSKVAGWMEQESSTLSQVLGTLWGEGVITRFSSTA